MGMPSITITFQQLGMTAIQRSQKGILGLIFTDAAPTLQGGHELTSAADLAEKLAGLSVANKEQIRLAFLGYINPPRKVIVYIMNGEDADLEDALRYFATRQVDYLVGPPDVSATDVQSLTSWIKAERANDHMVKAVLPNAAANHEAIVNFATEEILVGETKYTTAEYCSRIAGLIAGTPMTISATYAPLSEVSDCIRLTKEEMDAAIDAGKFIIFHDGKQVLTGRAVNSLVTVTQEKGEKFKKIKLVEVMDMIQNDIRITARESYIGKYTNSYDNKCLLVIAIQGYLAGLEQGGILAAQTSVVEIDLAAQENYLKSQGIDTSAMSEQEIKETNTGSKVFIRIQISILDAIEDIVIPITI